MRDWQLDMRLLRLERQVRRDEANPQLWPWDEFKVAPSCPPDTHIHVRGGWRWDVPTWGGEGIVTPDLSFDLTDTASYYGSSSLHTFTNPYWYIPVCVGIRSELLMFFGEGYIDHFGGGFVEVETAAEAEENISFVGDDVNEQTIPICILVLRNNGNVIDQCQYQFVDGVNQRRSYIYQEIRCVYRI